MAAGTSARDEAGHAAATAHALARKAALAATRAANFDKGADGEQAVAQALAVLSVDGFHLLHDRRCPNAGGNVDHVVIGPPGVFVLDAKAWAGVHVHDGQLRTRSGAHPEALERANVMADEARGALTAAGLTVPVHAGLVFVDAPDLPTTTLGDVAVLPLPAAAAALRNRPTLLHSGQVEAVLRALSAALPPFDAPPVFPAHTDLVGSDSKLTAELMGEAYWCFYVNEWRSGVNHRYYLKGEDGTTLGWRDARTGAWHVDPDLPAKGNVPRSPRLAAALLARVGKTGPAPDAPRVPEWWYGRNVLTSPLVSYVVGTRWRNGTHDRLYAFVTNAKTTRVDLGYVDLKTGTLHPAGSETIPGQRATRSVILAHLARSGTAPLGLGV